MDMEDKEDNSMVHMVMGICQKIHYCLIKNYPIVTVTINAVIFADFKTFESMTSDFTSARKFIASSCSSFFIVQSRAF